MGCKTHAFADPFVDIEEDVVSSLGTITQGLRNHHLILGQPGLQLLVITPITIMPAVAGQHGLWKRTVAIQFLSCHHLSNIARAAVEHEDESFVVEVVHLGIQRCNIVDSVTLRDLELADVEARGLIIGDGPDLIRDGPAMLVGHHVHGSQTYSGELRSRPREWTSCPVIMAE